MEEQSFNEKESFADNSGINRLSESRPKFKPVLVKKLLADESDDDSDDQAPNSDNSDEECDDFDSFQPLPEECTSDMISKTLINKTDTKININKKTEVISAVDGSVKIIKSNNKIIENTKCITTNDNVTKINEDKHKHKNDKDLMQQENLIRQIQCQPKCNVILDKRKSLPIKEYNEPSIKSKLYSPDRKHSFHNIAVTQANEVRDKPVQQLENYSELKDNEDAHRYFSTNKSHNINNKENEDKALVSSKIQMDQANNVKCSFPNSMSNTTAGVMETPMKHPHESVRPNPCHSHRNIFQTPQNKMINDYSKNPIQTPATIFSHWSQQHMAQTPMQNPISTTRESVQTPVTNIPQSQNIRHETPRYYSENKSIRRPLAETVYSGTLHGSQLPKLQEVPNETLPSLQTSKDNGNAVSIESTAEKKSLYSSSASSHAPNESKENWNPNKHDTAKSDKHSINSHVDVKSNLEYHNNAYHKNIQASRASENYPVRESKNSHSHIKNPSEQMSTVQCSVPQQSTTWNSRQNKIITVIDCQYLVLGVIGQGMSCNVVRAQNLSTSELRAIKCVNLNKMDKDSAQGCLQEICMLEKLKAPCIVHMYDFEIKQPWVHVVMELGDTDLSRLLKSMLQEKKQIPLTMILYYWTEMLTAVKHIHDNGVIHSDLKPANFLLVRGRLKLIDFGIASNINSDMTSVLKNCPIGTINYISPEALMDINAGTNDSPNHNVKYKISYKSDVWSLGCILYGLVYGVTPFHHIRHWAKVTAITDPKHKINFPLKTGAETVPTILIDVMRKCLQRNPKARPTVAELLEIPYLQTNLNPTIPEIPSNILIKIKHALSEEEWQQLTEILEKKLKV